MDNKDNTRKGMPNGNAQDRMLYNLKYLSECYGLDIDPKVFEKQPESVSEKTEEKPKIKNIFDRLKDYVIKCLKK